MISASLAVVAFIIVVFFFFIGQVEGRLKMILFAASASLFGVFGSIAVFAWDLTGRVVQVAADLTSSFNGLGS